MIKKEGEHMKNAQGKYDQLRHIISLFYELSDQNSYRQYRIAIHSIASYAIREVAKIERKERRK